MRTLLAFIALLIASPAFAMSESELNFCKAMKDPMQCVNQFLTAEHKAKREMEYLQQYLPQTDNQMALAEEQTRGMALFGAGNAMINGINQGFRPMPTPPPMVFQPMAMPFPQAGR
jgi:hypothetical protein